MVQCIVCGLQYQVDHDAPPVDYKAWTPAGTLKLPGDRKSTERAAKQPCAIQVSPATAGELRLRSATDLVPIGY